MKLFKKLKTIFGANKKEPNKNIRVAELDIVSDFVTGGYILNDMPQMMNPTPQMDVNFSGSTYHIEEMAYKAKRDEKLSTFKKVEDAKKSKAQKEVEEREREWIKDIIKIAKQPKTDGEKG